MEVVGLLQSYNSCLKRLLGLSGSFLSDPSQEDFVVRLSRYERKRTVLFKTLQLCDGKISELCAQISEKEKSQTLIENLRAQMSVREVLIQEVIATDRKIADRIEIERARILREANRSEKNREMLNKFKSSWIPESGERLDGRV